MSKWTTSFVSIVAKICKKVGEKIWNLSLSLSQCLKNGDLICETVFQEYLYKLRFITYKSFANIVLFVVNCAIIEYMQL